MQILDSRLNQLITKCNKLIQTNNRWEKDAAVGIKNTVTFFGLFSHNILKNNWFRFILTSVVFLLDFSST